MDIPKSFKPDSKDLDENVERLLDEELLNKPVITKIEEALRDYRELYADKPYMLRVHELVCYVREIEDLGLFVKGFCEIQLEGKMPLIRVLSEHHESVPLSTYDLFWDPQKNKLKSEWDDAPGANKRMEDYKLYIHLFQVCEKWSAPNKKR